MWKTYVITVVGSICSTFFGGIVASWFAMRQFNRKRILDGKDAFIDEISIVGERLGSMTCIDFRNKHTVDMKIAIIKVRRFLRADSVALIDTEMRKLEAMDAHFLMDRDYGEEKKDEKGDSGLDPIEEFDKKFPDGQIPARKAIREIISAVINAAS